MKDFTTAFDGGMLQETGKGIKVSCFEDGSFLWHRYCVDQAEVDDTTGDICQCGCADYKEYTNVAGTWRQCLRCWLARPKPKK